MYEDFIKRKCCEANPSIMELKFGCRVKFQQEDCPEQTGTIICRGNDDISNSYFAIDAGIVIDEEGKTMENIGHLHKTNFKEILGRPITLADVLLAINEKDGIYACCGGGSFVLIGNGEIIDTVCYWNLLTDLHGQSDETKELLAKILGWKAE